MSKESTRRWFKAPPELDVPRRGANMAEFVFKWGTNVPEVHPLNVHARKASKAIKDETNGRFDLQLLANNQLGGDSDMFSQLRSGALECFTLSGVNVLSTLVPSTSINGLGFAFPNYEAVWMAMDGKLGAYLRAQINKAGLVVMEKIWDNGFREITTSTKPITQPADLQGLHLRVPISALWISLFKSLGVDPAGINFSEVYSALEAQIFDGQENALAVIWASKLYEVQKYCSVTNHMWDGWWFLINRAAWDRLPRDIQEVVAKNLNAAAMSQRQDVARLNSSLKDDLAAKGLLFNDVDQGPFREKLRQSGFYIEWRGKFGEEAWELLEQATGKLA